MAHRGEQEGVHGGLFTYGGYDNENCGPIIAYEPLTSATYFQFKETSKAGGRAYEVISDTGTSFIGGPKSVVDKLAKGVGAKYVADFDSYVIPCDAKPPSLDIYIGSHKYSIEPVNYIVSAGEGTCLFALFPEEAGGFGPAWILGDPFIRQYCNVHDMQKQRMAFAKSLQK
ncbi:eukaryotic aspartyl protease [Cooperia oncophora]